MKRWWLASAAAVAVLAMLIGFRARSGEMKLPGSPCTRIEVGSFVRLSYDLYYAEDHSVVEDGHGTLEFEVGRGDVFPAVDRNVRGLNVGDTKDFPFTGDSGFGERHADWVVDYDRSYFGDVSVGMPVTVQGSTAVIEAVTKTSVRLDFNHPLAGKNLTMTVVVLECRERTAPGVRVEVAVAGDGIRTPQDGDKVSMNCEGAFADTGEVFFSSKDSAAPFVFRVGAGDVIPGLEMGVMKMSVGEKARLHIPADLAYGQKSDRVKVAVVKDVIFDVELLEIQQESSGS